MEDNVKEIRAALENEPRINLHRFPIIVTKENGDLVLEGEAENVAAKKLALLLAADIKPTARIVDRLRVTPAETMGDEEIRDHVCRVLLEESALERCLILTGNVDMRRQLVPEAAGSIVVNVADGIVTLNGSVPSLSHKRLAGVLAWWVPGCRDVVNGLEEVPPELDNDDELVDAVRLVLEKDPFVNATRIHASCKDCIVTLTGLVPNDTMKQLAERDAWYVLGVKEVVNEIRTEG